MKTAILHYTVPPVVGGVEAVILAHTKLLLKADYPVTVIAGAGERSALPDGVDFIQIAELNSRNPKVVEISQQLEAGVLTGEFSVVTLRLVEYLQDALQSFDTLIVHNVFTKHFNLPSQLRSFIYWIRERSSDA